MNILTYTFEAFLDMVRTFHGYEAPGVIMGGVMVDLAVGNLAEGTLYDAICETRSCLPDAIQLLTPCTTGNGWLKVVPLGLFALALYDKYTREGVRVFVDADRLEGWHEIKTWLFKLKPAKEQDQAGIIREIVEAGTSIYGVRHVVVLPEVAKKRHKGAIVVCPRCREAYPAQDGTLCLACQGNSPYETGA